MPEPELPSPVPLRAADHAWLRMERPDNRVIIHLALVFAGPLGLPALKRRLQERLLCYPVFSQRLVRRGWRGACWQTDPQFRLDHHVRQCSLPPGSGRAELKAWMAAQAGDELPPEQPLWAATLVHNVEGQRSALVLRVHHSLADGMSLMHVMAGLTDVPPGVAPRAPARTGLREPLGWPLLARRPARLLADAARLVFMRADRRTVLKGQPACGKSVAWSAPLPLAEVHALAARRGATVNDVMLALIADVLRQDLRLRARPRPAAPIRTVVPLNLRPPGEEAALGNRFGLVGCDLPVHLDDPLARLDAVRGAMSGLKAGLQGQLALALVQCAGRLPAWGQSLLLGLWARRCTLIVTNVIGPAEPRAVDGVALDELMLLVPQGMSVGVGVSILSYAGQLRVGFLVDTQLMPDCSGAAAGIVPAFVRLRRALRHAPVDLRAWRASQPAAPAPEPPRRAA